MENALTPAIAPLTNRLHEILPEQARAMAQEEAPRIGKRQARAHVGTAVTCRNTVFTVLFCLEVTTSVGTLDLVGHGTGDFFSEALELAIQDFNAKREEWGTRGLL